MQYFLKLPSFHTPLPVVYFFTFISIARFPRTRRDDTLLDGPTCTPQAVSGVAVPAAPSVPLCSGINTEGGDTSPSLAACPALAPSVLPRPAGLAVCAGALNQHVATVAKGTGSPRSPGESVPAPPLPTAEPVDQLCLSLNSCPPSPGPSTPIL